MTARNRSRDLRTSIAGTYWSNIGPTTVARSMQIGLTESNEDHIGNRTVVNPLSIRTNETSYPTLSGSLFVGATKTREFTNFPIGYKPGAVDPWVGFAPHTAPQLSALAWEILSGTNPSAPHVSIPSFIGELKDFLSLIRGNGERLLDLFKGGKRARVFLKSTSGWTFGALKDSVSTPGKLLTQVAEGYIAYRWALRPLYHDLMALVKFQKAVNDRLNWLYHLRQDKTLRRRVQLSTSIIEQAPTNVLLHSEGALIDGTRQLTYTRKVWGTAQWKLEPGSVIPQKGYAELKSLANALAAGFTSHEALATAWQLCPWSWLIDWFGNLQDTIQATNNTIGCTWANIALMRKTTSVATYKVTAKPAWVEVSNNFYYERSVRKERIPVSPLLPFSLTYLPILDAGKWSILAALAATRRLKFSGAPS